MRPGPRPSQPGAHVLPEWMQFAICAELPPERTSIFYIDEGDDVRAKSAEAKRVCARCPVDQECLAYGELTSRDFGTFGGLTAIERKRQRSIQAEDVTA